MNEKLIDNLSSQFSQMLNTFNNGAELPGSSRCVHYYSQPYQKWT